MTEKRSSVSNKVHFQCYRACSMGHHQRMAMSWSRIQSFICGQKMVTRRGKQVYFQILYSVIFYQLAEYGFIEIALCTACCDNSPWSKPLWRNAWCSEKSPLDILEKPWWISALSNPAYGANLDHTEALQPLNVLNDTPSHAIIKGKKKTARFPKGICFHQSYFKVRCRRSKVSKA